MRLLALAFIVFVCCSRASAQRVVSFGIAGGLPFTAPFSDQTFTPSPILPYLGSLYGVHSYSGSNEYSLGRSVEFHLPLNFSVEVDALFRPLDLTQQDYIIGPGPEPPISASYKSWEFPALAKYRASGMLIKPFIEAGTNFRAVANPGRRLSVKDRHMRGC